MQARRAGRRPDRRGTSTPKPRPTGGRTYWQIARANLFTFFNEVLFVIGVALLALGRINDAVVSAGLGLLNAIIGSAQEMYAKRKLDALRAQHATPVADDVSTEVPPGDARRWTVTRTPLQIQLELVVRAIMLMVALISGVILAQALLEGLPLVRVVQISAVLSGLVPYGLFLLVTVAYALGAAKIARHGALVQQVNAVESLSNIDVIVADTTGTLTTGRLTVHGAHPLDEALSKQDVESLLAVLAHSVSANGVITAALRQAFAGPSVELREEVPPDPVRRWGGAVLRDPSSGEYDAFVLGAVEALGPALSPTSDGSLVCSAESLAAQGLRVLLFARAADASASLSDDAGRPRLPALLPVALVTFYDEIRTDARDALTTLMGRGIEVKVVSGDDPRTAAELASRLGLADSDPASGADLATLGPDQLALALRRGSVFGRVSAEQKEQLVDTLVRSGSYVAMIGDGVDDVRALERAQVGVAVESGSTPARDVADLVLLGDSLSALVEACDEGGRIIGGLTTALMVFVTRVMVSMLCVVGISILGLGFAYEPAQMALTLFTVGLPTTVLTLWARPRRPNPHLVTELARFVTPAAVVTAVLAVGLYATMFTLLTTGLQDGLVPPGAVTQFEKFTGLARNDDAFVETTATAVAQTGLSMFTSVTAFVLLLMLEPPAKFFAGWAPVREDKRPALLVIGLFAAFVAVLYIPALAGYFGLIQPGGFVVPLVAGATVLWFFVLRTMYRRDLLPRALGMGRKRA